MTYKDNRPMTSVELFLRHYVVGLWTPMEGLTGMFFVYGHSNWEAKFDRPSTIMDDFMLACYRN